MFTVIVTFEPGADRVDANYAAVKAILSELVAHQPGFRRGRVHLGHAGDEKRVINYMEWESEDAFLAFRASNRDEIMARVGEFGPSFAFYAQIEEILATEPV